MRSARRRLETLEARAEGDASPIPTHVSVLLTAIERHRADAAGEEPPAYTLEELESMRRDDMEIISGGGVVGEMRGVPGWELPEGQVMLDGWEEDARRRIDATKSLPAERWGEVYGDDL